MTRHIIKIIWNERKANFWIVLEYVLVFCVLWFCFDYLYFIAKSCCEPLGFDIENTYTIQIQTKHKAENLNVQTYTEEEKNSLTLSIIERIEKYPGVEYIGVSSDYPYNMSTVSYSYVINGDSGQHSIQIREVSSGYFDVFKMKLTQGRFFDWADPACKNQIVLSPAKNGLFGSYLTEVYPVTDVRTLGYLHSDRVLDVVGNVEKLKQSFFTPYKSCVFIPLDKKRIDLGRYEIVIRIRPEVVKGFKERFASDMKEQLTIGPYRWGSIVSVKENRDRAFKWSGIVNNLKNIYAITLFLIINIFLGIIGTFWYRMESRKSEIGLRIALGSSKRKIRKLMYGETLLLLFIASLIGLNICINIGQTDLLTMLGMPQADPHQRGSVVLQYLINFVLTFSFLAVVSLIAVWYPVKQSSNMQPAEVLHEE